MAPLEDLSDAIAEMETGSYRIRRPAGQTTTKGRVTQNPPTIHQAPGSLQPLTGRELQRLPEGMRDREVRAFFTAFQIKSKDVLEADGFDWEVDSVSDWSVLGNFYRALMTKGKATP